MKNSNSLELELELRLIENSSASFYRTPAQVTHSKLNKAISP